MNTFGVIIVIVGAGLIVASQTVARVTNRSNRRILGTAYNDRRVYVLVGIGLVLVGVAVLAGWA